MASPLPPTGQWEGPGKVTLQWKQRLRGRSSDGVIRGWRRAGLGERQDPLWGRGMDVSVHRERGMFCRAQKARDPSPNRLMGWFPSPLTLQLPTRTARRP